MSITKRHAAALERLFSKEVECGPLNSRLPPVVKLDPNLAAELEEMGLAEPLEITLGGRLPVSIRGHVLTWAGHYAYSAWAAENCPDEDEP